MENVANTGVHDKQEQLISILGSSDSDGAKIAAIAMLLTGKTTSRELAEVCGSKLRTMERHHADATLLVRRFAEDAERPLRNIAEGVRKSAEEDTQICVENPRADSCARATKESPSEIVILNNNTPLPPEGATPLEALRAFEAYNEVALRCSLPQAAKLTPGRQRKILARLKTYGLDGWKHALGNIEKSAFLLGQTSHGFRADLDFVCQQASFDRLHDGGYGNGAKVSATQTASQIRMRPMTNEERELYRNAGCL